ncbi:putative Adaptin N terminal region/non-SMC mitotic condensation complex subunit 1 [Leishmania naiffi]|uniref:Adaptin N terminal region/non-SMC mitotic condensation complex subunit 1 n=1 Tax=Leishmania naiffi TaxID=5678 RepID=A0AAW3B343_9TRYP
MNGAALIEQATFVTERAWEYASNTTSVFSKARSLVAGDAQFFSVAPRVDDLRRSLSSESLHDKRDGMKRIVAQMCKGSDMRHFFPDVVKNIHVPYIELRKLIYVFIVYYAEDCPNETLLSISAFQKDLLDPSMHVRALALRMLASLRIHAIHPVVLVAVRKCASDMAPLVRKTAALALVQMHTVARQELDRDTVRQLLRTFLSDRSPEVVGAAAMAYMRICPEEWDLIHGVYRRLCRILKDCEEWGQVVLLRLLLRYARRHFVDPRRPFAARAARCSRGSSGMSGKGTDSDDDDDDATSSSHFSIAPPSREYEAQRGDAAAEAQMDPDLLLLLNSTRPLLWSLNSSVVVAAIALLCHCGTPRFQETCVKSAMRLLNTCTEGHIAVLHVIYDLLLLQRDAFLPYLKSFFLFPLDAADVRHVKLRILSHLVTSATSAEVSREFRSYLRQYNDAAVVEAIQGLAQAVQQYPPFAAHTIRLVTPLLSSRTSSPVVVADAVAILRVLVLQGTDPVRISRLACQLTLDIMEERITEPSAVATILWLTGENISKHPSMAAAAPDCFRVFAKRFGGLTSEVKRQVLTLGCKVWVQMQGNSELSERFKQVYHYVAELARYDDDYMIRDEERLTEATFDRQSDTFTGVRAALLRAKPLPDVNDPHSERAGLEIGTFSNLLGPAVRVLDPLPTWATEATDGTLRRSFEEMNTSAAAVALFERTSGEKESGSNDSSYTDGEESDDSGDATSSSGSYESSYSASSNAENESGKSSSHSDGDVAAPSRASAMQKVSSDVRTAKASLPKFAVKITMQSAPPSVPSPAPAQATMTATEKTDASPAAVPELPPARETVAEPQFVVEM